LLVSSPARLSNLDHFAILVLAQALGFQFPDFRRRRKLGPESYHSLGCYFAWRELLWEGTALFMIDTMLDGSKRHASNSKHEEASLAPLRSNGSATRDAESQEATGRYFVLAPDGLNLTIPKELYLALSDFIKTRKCPGSITIQFRSGGIICVEAVAKKTFRNPSNTIA
jgi:hypothetical protein